MAMNKQELLDLINNLIPDNDNQEVSASDVRSVMSQVVTSSINATDISAQSVDSDFTFNGAVNGMPNNYYYEILRSESMVTQTGGAIDTKVPVTFGAEATSLNAELKILADGTIEVLKSGAVFTKIIIEFGRTSSNGFVEVFTQAEVSIDGGTTWVGRGTAINRRMQNSGVITTLDDGSPIFAEVGTLFRFVWSQSSVGGDPSSQTVGVADGVLSYAEPSAALKALGIGNSPSATIVFYGLNGEHNV